MSNIKIKKTTYINPNEVKEIVFCPESEYSSYKWYDEELSQRKTILWGLIKSGWTEYKPAGWGWGSRRYTDEEILGGWNSLKIDKTGLKPKLISKAETTIYLRYKQSTKVYHDTNEDAINFAENVANKTGCTLKI